MLVVDSNRAPQQLDAVEVIHRQNCAPLVLVLEEAEAVGGGGAKGGRGGGGGGGGQE